MKYLFLDDERNPSDVTWIRLHSPASSGQQWNIVRSFDQACQWVLEHGFPDVVSFDHDLGDAHYHGDYKNGKTGYDFARWLVDYDLDTDLMPRHFAFTVHSMNPIGAENIRRLLNGYIGNR